ncbi:MAG: hypothetical protein HQL36_00895 [Alphaproteobacteria bacterium]|nr:hypothetical protein [Alphaproteobacteria bacterium]
MVNDEASFRVMRHPAFLIALVFVVSVKIFLFLNYAPYELAKNSPVLDYASAILKDSRWLTDARELESPFPFLLWRPIGYPLAIAFSKIAAGDNWSYFIIIIQNVLSVVSSVYAAILFMACGMNRTFSVISFLLLSFSVSLSNDLLLFSDSLASSVFIICISVVCTRFVMGHALEFGVIIYTGFGLSLCFLLRDSYLFIGAFTAVAVFFLIAAGGATVPNAMKRAVLFVAPLVIITSLIMGWNYMRTGHPVITTGGSTGYLLPVLKSAQQDLAVFGSDSLLDQVAREKVTDFDDADTYSINYALFERYGFNAFEISEMMKEKYFHTIVNFPDAYFASLRVKLNFRKQAPLLGDPLAQIDDLDYWASLSGGEAFETDWRSEIQRFYETRDPRTLSGASALKLVPRLFFRLTSTTLYFVFLLLVPVVGLWGMRHEKGSTWRRVSMLFLALWVVYALVVLMYAQFVMYARYLAPVSFIPILCSLTYLSIFFDKLRNREMGS